MTGTAFKRLDQFTDRHGKPRVYYRLGRGRRIRLPNDIESAEFREAYRRAAELLTSRDEVRQDEPSCNTGRSTGKSVTADD